MKRAIICLAILMVALGGVAMTAMAAYPASSGAGSGADAGTAPPQLRGYAGKIIAVKPPGDWDKSSGAAGKGNPFSKLVPLVLPVFGTDVNIAASNETFVASNPQNPLQFIAGSNAVARAFTSNGGQNWTVTSPAGIGDPVGTYDNAGNAYFGQLSTGTCPDPVVVSRSSDGGATWGSQVQALSDASPSDHFIDKPWIAADTHQASPFYGRLYVTASSFYAPGCNLSAYINDREVIAFSTNQGATWSSPVTLSDASHDQDQFTNPVVASNGTLYVSYQYQNCTYNCTSSIPMIQLITKSTDGGVTFSPSITMTGPISPTGSFVGGYQYLYAGSTSSGFRHNDQAIIGVSPTNPQHVYAVWTDGRFESSFVYQSVTGQHGDIVFTRSTDGGATWSSLVKINDDNVQGKDQFFPWMTVGTDGTIHVAWMDRREAAVNGFPYREYYSQSTDEGATWSVNQPVGDAVGTPSSFIGDYAGVAVNSDNSRVLPVWTDQRSGQRMYTDAGIIAGGSTPTATPSQVSSSPTATPTACGVTPAWQAGPTLDPARELFQGALGSDGKFYETGGQSPDGTLVVGAMSRFNPATNSWESVAPMPVPVGQNSVGADGGKVFVAAGCPVCAGGGYAITNTLQIYDIASNTWSFGASMPAAVEAAAGVALNGKFYVIGGDDITNSGRTTYIYDVATNTWSTGAQIPDTQGRTNTYATAANGLIYVFGGATWIGGTGGNTIDTMISYNPGSNTWTQLASANLGGIGNYAGVAPYGAGKLLVADGGDISFSPSATTHIYDIASNTFTAGPTMLTPHLGHAQGALPDGRVIVYSGRFAGSGGTGTDTNTSELLAAPSVCSTATPTVPASTVTATRTSTPTNTPITPGPTNTSPPQPTNTTPPQASNTPGTPAATDTPSTPLPTSTTCPIQFSDVPVGSTFYEFIRCLACRGIINGYPDGTFKPNNNVTRGQLSKIVSNSAGFSDPATQMFEDVPPGSTFFDYIGRLASRGYINGYPCGGPGEPCVPPSNLPYFRPNANATRGQISKIVSNAAGFIEPVSGQTFEDVPPGSTFYEFIERLATRGVMSGYPCGSVTGEPCVPPENRPYFRPNNNATRGQTSKIVANTFFPACVTPSR